MSRANDIRYRFEHRFLRDFYFHNPKHFEESLIAEPEFLFQVLDNLYEEQDVHNPYAPEQITVSFMEEAGGARAVKISLPDPEEPPLCRRIYAFLDPEEKKECFFCIESDNDKDAAGARIGQWCFDGKCYSHIGYVGRPATPEEEFKLCAEYYKDFDLELFTKLFEESKKAI